MLIRSVGRIGLDMEILRILYLEMRVLTIEEKDWRVVGRGASAKGCLEKSEIGVKPFITLQVRKTEFRLLLRQHLNPLMQSR